MNKTPEHLGGHLNRTNTDEPLLKYIQERFKTTSMLDIGCGPGGMKQVANSMDINWYGVDGDTTVIENTDYSLVHDFTLGEATLDKGYDAVLVDKGKFMEEMLVVNPNIIKIKK